MLLHFMGFKNYAGFILSLFSLSSGGIWDMEVNKYTKLDVYSKKKSYCGDHNFTHLL